MSSGGGAEPAYSPSLWTAGDLFPHSPGKELPRRTYPKPFAPHDPAGVCTVAWGWQKFHSHLHGLICMFSHCWGAE